MSTPTIATYTDFTTSGGPLQLPTHLSVELQVMMRHKSFQTTQKHIRMSATLEQTAEKLAVPGFVKTGT